ncbi:MAG: hypothetical protein ACRC4P_00340 [Aeromonas sp.]
MSGCLARSQDRPGPSKLAWATGTVSGGNRRPTLTVSRNHYFFLAYFMESSATARLVWEQHNILYRF